MPEHNGTTGNGAVRDTEPAPENDRDDEHHSGWDGEREGNGHRLVRFPVDSQVVADAGGTRLMTEGHPAFPRAKRPDRHPIRWLVVVSIVAAILFAAWPWGMAHVRYALDTVSTDDAFVASHITYASPRIEGIVTEVTVDQDDRVEPGQLLAKLDREPFELAEAQEKASLEEARADVAQARAQVRAQIGRARAAYYRRKNAQETLRRQIATLRAQFAALRARQSSRGLAEVDQRRIENLVRRGSATQSELDQRNNTLKVATEQEREARAEIQEIRALLGLPPDENNPLNVPAELENQQSTVQSAVSEIASSLAEVGIPFDPRDAAQAHAFQDFLRPEGDRSAGEGLEAVVEAAPAVKVALRGRYPGGASARRRKDETSVDRGPFRDFRIRPGSPGQPRKPGRARPVAALDPADLRLDRGQLQGNTD